TYEMYYDYREPINKIAGHRILALNRGEREGVLAVKVEVETGPILNYLQSKVIINPSSPSVPYLLKAIEDSYFRLIAPAVEREIRNQLTEQAEEQAIRIFSINLRNILLQPPVKGQIVLGIDPGYRTGCKLAVVDDTGKLLEVGVIYPTLGPKQIGESREKVIQMVNKYQVKLIAIGNGTASRETEQFIADLMDELPPGLRYTIVSEAGASVYSASQLAREEFPHLDVSERSAISIARRIQDPLAELVKIEPKAIGVGQYQHDVNQKKLEQSLAAVVESVVNSVGVDLNTASAELLKYVAGIKPQLAKNIVAYREEKGKFRSREELKSVPRLGPATFLQCAGFLRIPEGINPLDNTAVHPESYSLAEKLLEKAGFNLKDFSSQGLKELEMSDEELMQLAEELKAGLPTLKDILAELKKPGRDPREDLPSIVFKTGITKFEDLQVGMLVTGVVRNVVDFGAFIDLGVKQDGLVHISELADSYVKHPTEVVAVGDQVTALIISLDQKRNRIGLSLRPSKIKEAREQTTL
ncbi:MAG TPA: RNA-binding transcriptional accessory protein, partial [Clostridia bacterium]|nr:RNA-binding transcriptional accessory protein [Clostridia bacterium]